MTYVHGYTDRETRRLLEQSLILEELLHSGTSYPPGSHVLEVGCGVGAQTALLARRNPGIYLTSIDISESSVIQARKTVEEQGCEGVTIKQDNIYDHHLGTNTFDHLFVCFLLEHLEDPPLALEIMKNLLKRGGTLTIIEGDHGSGFWTPESEASRLAWQGLVASQLALGHDPNIGRRLFPLLQATGMSVEDVSPRAVYADRSNPLLLDGVVNQIIAPMVYSAEMNVLSERIIDPETWEQGLKDISMVAIHEEGTFFYTWFKGVCIKV